LAVAEKYPEDKVEAWCEDEARFGLQPIMRRVWARRTQRPTAEVAIKYEWFWLYAAVHPASGKVFWLILPSLDENCVQIFLDEFAVRYGGTRKRMVLVWDGAPAHRSGKLKVPERITLISIPAYTPELNPSERVWTLVKEAVANEASETLDELEQKVCSRCQNITSDEVSARTNYHWWKSL